MEKEEEIKKEEKQEITLEKYNLKSWFKSSFVGFLVGLAVILPGISGSTIAILFKLYDKLLYAVSSLIKKFKSSIIFLIPIIVGALIGFVLGFFAIQSVVDKFTFILCSTFGGLMLGATPGIYHNLKNQKFTPLRIFLIVLGLAIPITLSSVFANLPELDNSNLFETFPWWIYLIALILGAVLSLTQIIPGLSATVLLMSIGFFKPIMDAVHISTLTEKPLWIVFLLLMVVGFILGFFFLSKLMTKLFTNYHVNMYFLITGLTFGSIVSVFYNVDIKVVYDLWAQGGGNLALDLGIGIPLFFVGAIITFLLVRYELKREKNTESIGVKGE